MKKLARLRTVTSKGKVILSPFVFKEEEAERRIESALKTYKKGTGNETTIVMVQRYPRTAVWCLKKHGPQKKNIESLISHIKALKLRWEVMKDADYREDA